MPSILRQFIYIDEQPPAEVDWSNSNPFYFGCIAKYPNQVKKLLSNHHAIDVISYSYERDKAYTYFIDKCLAGEIYEYTGERLQLERAKAKNLLMCIMNSNPNQFLKKKAKFKTISKALVSVCNQLNETRAIVPMLLQRLEAAIVIDRVAKELMDCTNSPFTTIHDSLLLSRNDVDKAYLIIDKVHNQVGLPTPCFKVKCHKPFLPT